MSPIESVEKRVAPVPSLRGAEVLRNLRALRQRMNCRPACHRVPAEGRCRRVVLGCGVVALVPVLLLFILDGAAIDWAGDTPRSFRKMFQVVTRFGKSDWLLIGLAACALLVALADWRKVSPRIAAAWIEVGRLAAFGIGAVAFSGILANVVKCLVGRSRPVLFEAHGAFTLTPISVDYAHVSFPSGHAATAASAAVAALLVWRQPLGRTVIVAFALLIGISRVMVRAHFPSDVAAGLLLGGATAYCLAHWLAVRGVAFRRREDGTLVPRAAAIRRAFRSRAHLRCSLGGLRRAWR